MNSTEYMTDSQGRQVPVHLVKPIDHLRDQTVRSIMGRALALRETVRQFKADAWSDIQHFLALSAEQHQIHFGGKKGNITLTTYDGQYKLLIAVNDTLQFNEKLQIAKELIDTCIKRWSNDAKAEIRLLVEDAFLVDRAGNLNKHRILGLRRINIQDPQWQEAMQAITDSIQVVATKTYMRFYQRMEDGTYIQIPLDMAAL
jgi:hypothetical protein